MRFDHRLLWLAAAQLACVTYRDRIVVVTQHTVIDASSREAPSTAASASVDVGALGSLSLPAVPGRLDAPTIGAALDGYGAWTEHPAYGAVWIPSESARGDDFVPYLTAGQWVPTRDGWYWQSDYAWGAVPFHYGRWVMLSRGWAWVPGAAFAPAWVDWRLGNGWAAWAPLAPEGAAVTAPHVYCAWSNLRGHGLVARVVRGRAATSLYAYTTGLRTSCGYGGTYYSPGPPVPTAVPTGAERQWASALPAPRPRAGVATDGSPTDSMGRPPRSVSDVPRVARALNEATGTLRPLDAYAPRANISAHAPAAHDSYDSTDMDPPSDGTRISVSTSLGTAPLPGLSEAAPAAVGPRASGYSIIPARRITWRPTPTPSAVVAEAAPVYAPQRLQQPPPVIERAVAMPPSLFAQPSFAPSIAPPTAPPWRPSPNYGGGLPSQPSLPMGAPPGFMGGYAPVYRAPPAMVSAPTYVAPMAASAPVARPVFGGLPTTIASPGAPMPSMGRAFSVPTTIAPGAGFRVR